MKYILCMILIFFLCIKAGEDEDEFVWVEPTGQVEYEPFLWQNLKETVPESLDYFKKEVPVIIEKGKEVKQQWMNYFQQTLPILLEKTKQLKQYLYPEDPLFIPRYEELTEKSFVNIQPPQKIDLLTPVPQKIEKNTIQEHKPQPSLLSKEELQEIWNTFDTIFPKSLFIFNYLDSYTLYEGMEKFISHLKSKNRTLQQVIHDAYVHIKLFSRGLDNAIKQHKITQNIAQKSISNAYQYIIKLYFVTLSVINDQFTEHYLFKGGLIRDPSYNVIDTIFDQENIKHIETIEEQQNDISSIVLMDAIRNPLINPDSAHVIKKNYYEKKSLTQPGVTDESLLEWFYTSYKNNPDLLQLDHKAESDMQPFILYRSFLYQFIKAKKNKSIYSQWIGFYPVLSNEKSPLEKSYYKYLLSKIRKLYAQAIRSGIDIQLKKNFYLTHEAFKWLIMRTSSTVYTVQQEEKEINRIYVKINGRPQDIKTSFDHFNRNILNIYQLLYKHIQERKKIRQPVDDLVKQVLRYKRFNNFQDFIRLKDRLYKGD